MAKILGYDAVQKVHMIPLGTHKASVPLEQH